MKRLEDFAGSVSVVVSSCDRFFDAWRPFAFFFRKHWNDCPFPVYLIVNELQVRSKFIRRLAVGPDRGWATNMQRALGQIETPYLLYFQEDYFLNGPVDRTQLAADFERAVTEEAAALCFVDLGLLEPAFTRSEDRIAVVPRESEGRTRLQVTLWKTSVLSSLLRPGENAWQMEARGSERTRGLHMLSYARRDHLPLPYLMSAIVRGLWTPEARALCAAHHLSMRPRFRAELAGTKLGRRWKRAISRARYPFALAQAKRSPIDLDCFD